MSSTLSVSCQNNPSISSSTTYDFSSNSKGQQPSSLWSKITNTALGVWNEAKEYYSQEIAPFKAKVLCIALVGTDLAFNSGKVTCAALVGVTGGVIEKTALTALLLFTRISGIIPWSSESSEQTKKYDAFISNISAQQLLTLSIQEELLYRGILQPTLKIGVAAVLPNISSFIQTLIANVSISTLFGISHLYRGTGTKSHMISSTIGGLTYGFLKEKFGIISSICAHVTYNFLDLPITITPLPRTPEMNTQRNPAQISISMRLKYTPTT